jgi:hypothetical protein
MENKQPYNPMCPKPFPVLFAELNGKVLGIYETFDDLPRPHCNCDDNEIMDRALNALAFVRNKTADNKLDGYKVYLWNLSQYHDWFYLGDIKEIPLTSEQLTDLSELDPTEITKIIENIEVIETLPQALGGRWVGAFATESAFINQTIYPSLGVNDYALILNINTTPITPYWVSWDGSQVVNRQMPPWFKSATANENGDGFSLEFWTSNGEILPVNIVLNGITNLNNKVVQLGGGKTISLKDFNTSYIASKEYVDEISWAVSRDMQLLDSVEYANESGDLPTATADYVGKRILDKPTKQLYVCNSTSTGYEWVTTPFTFDGVEVTPAENVTYMILISTQIFNLPNFTKNGEAYLTYSTAKEEWVVIIQGYPSGADGGGYKLITSQNIELTKGLYSEYKRTSINPPTGVDSVIYSYKYINSLNNTLPNWADVIGGMNGEDLFHFLNLPPGQSNVWYQTHIGEIGKIWNNILLLNTGSSGTYFYFIGKKVENNTVTDVGVKINLITDSNAPYGSAGCWNEIERHGEMKDNNSTSFGIGAKFSVMLSATLTDTSSTSIGRCNVEFPLEILCPYSATNNTISVRNYEDLNLKFLLSGVLTEVFLPAYTKSPITSDIFNNKIADVFQTRLKQVMQNPSYFF